MMKLNELLSVIDEQVCTIAFKFDKSVYGIRSEIYYQSEIYEVVRVYAMNDIIMIEVK